MNSGHICFLFKHLHNLSSIKNLTGKAQQLWNCQNTVRNIKIRPQWCALRAVFTHKNICMQVNNQVRAANTLLCFKQCFYVLSSYLITKAIRHAVTHMDVPEFLLASLKSAEESVMFSRRLLQKTVINRYGLPKSSSIPPQLGNGSLWMYSPRKALHFRKWRRLPSVMVTQYWPWKGETDTWGDNWHPA